MNKETNVILFFIHDNESVWGKVVSIIEENMGYSSVISNKIRDYFYEWLVLADHHSISYDLAFLSFERIKWNMLVNNLIKEYHENN